MIQDRNGNSHRCVSHPKYKAIRKPRKTEKNPHGCSTCNQMYGVVHGSCPECEHVVTIPGGCLNLEECHTAREQYFVHKGTEYVRPNTHCELCES